MCSQIKWLNTLYECKKQNKSKNQCTQLFVTSRRKTINLKLRPVEGQLNEITSKHIFFHTPNGIASCR